MKLAMMFGSALVATALAAMLIASSAEAARKFPRTYGYQHSRGYVPCTSDPKGFCINRHAK
jgi:hypothetical protein